MQEFEYEKNILSYETKFIILSYSLKTYKYKVYQKIDMLHIPKLEIN